MRVLILNWRDIRNPRAGGAEVLTHEIAKHLVSRGDDVTWFTSRPSGMREDESVDGIRVVRRGSELTTRLFAPSFARRSRWDVVVEEINTLPYFAPLWARDRSLLFIPQLAREVWWREVPLPLAALGYASEPVYLSAYRSTETITISASTETDLRKIGMRAPIHVIPMAASAPALPELEPKTLTGRLVIVGRLVPSKRVDHAIRALSVLRKDLPTATLAVVGVGPELEHLRALASSLGVEAATKFLGRVSEDEKQRILRDTDVLVACAVREGWGLTVTEAARVGTPSVCYRIPGLRDSVVDGRTGLLTGEDPTALATAIAGLLAKPEQYEKMRRRAWEHTAGLSWLRTGTAFANVLGSAGIGSA